MVAVTRLKNIHRLTIWDMMFYRVIILRKSLFHQQIWQIILHKFFRVHIFLHHHIFLSELLLNRVFSRCSHKKHDNKKMYSKNFWLYCHVKFLFKLFVKIFHKIVFKQKRLSENHYTGGSLLTRFFETLEKQPCKQKTV